MKKIHLFLISALFTFSAYAQGDGPHSYLLVPKGVTGVNAKYLNLSQNITPTSIFTPGANFDINVFPVTLFHTFSIGGRYAMAFCLINPGSTKVTATAVPPGLPIPVGTEFTASGLSDGFVGFRMGLHGAPAISPSEFLKEKMRFSIFADARVWYSGTYDSKKALNMGSNRMTYEFSLPMAIPLNRNREKATWLEVSPTIEFFGANTDPSKVLQPTVKKVTQAPLFVIENHLSHYFSKKFWAVGSLRFRQGGATSNDGNRVDNQMSILGVAGGIGYQALPFLGLYSDYGTVLAGYNDAKSDMFRVTMVFAYANLKKK